MNLFQSLSSILNFEQIWLNLRQTKSTGFIYNFE